MEIEGLTELALTVRMRRMNSKEPTDLREHLRPDRILVLLR